MTFKDVFTLVQGLTEAHGILMSERESSRHNGSHVTAILLEGSESSPFKCGQHSETTWIVKDCQAAVTKKVISKAQQTLAVSNPVMQFNVKTARNPILQEAEQPLASM